MTGVRVDGPLRVASGASSLLPVVVRNDGPEACDVRVRAVGLDPSWTDAHVTVGPVPPGGEVLTHLSVTVPAGSPAGSFPFVVVAQPLHALTGAAVGAAAETDASVVVGDASRLTAQLAPREPAGIHGKRFHVVLENRTTAPMRVRLDAQPSKGLHLDVRSGDVDVPPGGTTKVRLHARVNRRVGGQTRRMPFVVTAQGATTPVRLDGMFLARPLLGTSVTRVVALMAVLALWASVSMLAVSAVSDRAKDRDGESVASELEAAPPSEDGDGQDGGGGDGDGDEEAGAGTGRGSARMVADRVNGVVTGTDPAGVTVTLQPTSLVDEEATGAQLPSRTLLSGVRGKLAASLVQYDTRPSMSSRRSTTTQDDGSWAFAKVDTAGYYLLTFAKPGYTTKRLVVEQKADDALPPVEVELVAGTGRLSGSVVHAGRPVPGATVVLTDGTVTVTTTTRTTGAVGQWSVDGLTTPATYLVSASARGLALSSKLVRLEAGGTVTAVDLSLARGVQSLVGTVTATTATGRTVEAGGVTVTATDGTTTRSATSVSRAPGDGTSPVGAYTLPDLPVGRWTVTFSADGYLPRTSEVVLDGSASDLDLGSHLVSSGATVRGTVTDATGTGLVGAGLVLSGDAGVYKLVTADGGSFAVAGVAPGAYVLTAQKHGHDPATAAVQAEPGRTTDVQLALGVVPDTGIPSTSVVRGRVVDARNGGLIACPTKEPACIRVSVAGHAAVPVLPSAEYTVPGTTGLPPGLHTVVVEATGYERAEVAVQVPLAGVAVAPVVALHPRVAVTGKITPGAPAPLPPTCVVAVPVDSGTGPAPTSCTPTKAEDGTATCTAAGVPTASCTLTDASGNYTVPGLERAGSYAVHVLPAAGPAAAEWIPVPGVTLTLNRGETKRYDAQMDRRARLRLLLRMPDKDSGSLVVPTGPVTVEVHASQGSAKLATVVSGTPGAPPGDPSYGQVLVPALADGRVLVDATLGTPATHRGSAVADVGTNQTTEATLVLTTQDPNQYVGRVVWRQDDKTHPVVGAKVKLTGTVGFDGTTDDPGTVDVVTDANGCFAVTSSGGDPVGSGFGDCSTVEGPGRARLSLVKSPVAVTVTAGAGAGTFSGANVMSRAGTGATVETVVDALPLPFSGRLLVDGAPRPDDSELDLSRATVTVTTPARGAGTVVITPAEDGTLTWSDSRLGEGEVHPGTYKVRASLPDHDSVDLVFECVRGAAGEPPAEPCDLTPSVGSHVPLTVTVVDAQTDAPVPGAVVTLSGGKAATTTVSVPPGGDQTVRFPGLSAKDGPYTITARAPGYAAAESDPVHLVAGKARAHVAELTRLGAVEGTVSGLVGGQSAGLGGVRVTATQWLSGDEPPDPAAPTSVVFEGVTDARGAFRITGTTEREGLPLTQPGPAPGDPPVPSTWLVTAHAMAGYSQDPDTSSAKRSFVLDATAPAEADVSAKTLTGVDLVLQAQTVTLEVTLVDDATKRNPVLGATVTLQDGGGDPQTITRATPDTGVWTASGLKPTVHSLQVSAPGFAPSTTTVLLQPGIDTTRVTIVLADRKSSIAVHVRSQVGIDPPQALPLARVTITGSAPDAAPSSAPPTDDNGDTQVVGLADDTYTVLVEGPEGSPWSSVTRTVKLSAGQLAVIEATLQQALPSVTVAVTSTTKEPMAGALVTLVSQEGGASQAPQQADANGRTTFLQVRPGTYTVTSSGPGPHLPGSVPKVVVDDSGVVEPDSGTPGLVPLVVQERKIDVAVRTSDAAVPAPLATVTVAPEGSGQITSQQVTADGQPFVLYAPLGTYEVTATAAGYDPAVAQAGDDAAVELLLEKSSTGAVRVTVAAETPAAAQNATVTLSGSTDVHSTGPDNLPVLVSGLAATTPAEPLTVSVRLADGRTSSAKVAVEVGKTTDVPFTFSKTATGTLDVHVTKGSADVANAVVTVSGDSRQFTTDDRGRVSIGSLAPATYAVTAVAPDGTSATVQATVVANTKKDVAIALPTTVAPGSVVVQVRNGTAPVASASVTASGPSGSAVGTTTASGDHTFSLPPGTYTFAATTADGQSGTVGGVTIASGTNPAVTLSVSYTGTLKVTVLRSGGAAQSGATVTGTCTSASPVTDASGVAFLSGVPVGSCTVTATWVETGVGTHTGSTTATVAAGATTPVTVTLTAPAPPPPSTP